MVTEMTGDTKFFPPLALLCSSAIWSKLDYRLI
jgi:hypothetical protein